MHDIVPNHSPHSSLLDAERSIADVVKLSRACTPILKWPRRAVLSVTEAELELRIREVIRLIASEADPKKRKALAEQLDHLLRIESDVFRKS